MSSFIDFEPHEQVDDNLKMISSDPARSTANGLGKVVMEEV